VVNITNESNIAESVGRTESCISPFINKVCDEQEVKCIDCSELVLELLQARTEILSLEKSIGLVDGFVNGGDVMLKNVENVKECEKSECRSCVRWKQELKSVVIELNSLKEIIKILKEELESIGIEVKNRLGTTQNKYNVNDNSEDDWNLMNLEHAMKKRNLPRYLPVPVLTSNRFSVLGNSQYTCESVSEQPQIIPTWSDMMMSRQRRGAYGRRQITNRMPVVKDCSNLPSNSDAGETSSSIKTGNQIVGKPKADLKKKDETQDINYWGQPRKRMCIRCKVQLGKWF
jgi:hypothetical protein